jgi:chemotaxis protein methyltransferase CheR
VTTAEPPVHAEPSRQSVAVARLESAITRQTGLSAQAGLASRLARALREHDDVDRLAQQLEARRWHEPEWQALITQVLVHETYLFRDWPQLDHLRQAGLPGRIAAAQRAGTRRLSLWSAGCSSGEETYSLAALALRSMVDAGVAHEHGDALRPSAGWTVEVIGSDISREVLSRAREGVFSTEGLSPFRAMQSDYADFFPVPQPGLQSDPERDSLASTRVARSDLRAHVRFVHDNLLDGPPPVLGADVVVCRNVLIYLTDTARNFALTKLVAAVAADGFLLLGPTDPPPPASAFEAVWSAGPVIYRRR